MAKEECDLKFSLLSQRSKGSMLKNLDLIIFPHKPELVRECHKLLAHKEKLKVRRCLMPQPPRT